jgi:hypothetical protein
MALGVAIENSVRRRYRRSTDWDVPFTVLSGLAIPVGSVVGYNLGAPSRSHIGSRLELPAVGLTGIERPDRSVDCGVKVQLAGLRF